MTDKTFERLRDRVNSGRADSDLIKVYTLEVEKRDHDPKNVKDAVKEALKVAEDFYYPQSVKDDLNEAQSVSEVNRIMKNAKKYI